MAVTPPTAPTSFDDRLAALEPAETEAYVDALLDLGFEAVFSGGPAPPSRRLMLAADARTVAERIGYARGVALAEGLEGVCYSVLSDFRAARPRLEAALAALDPDDRHHGTVSGALANLCVSIGDYETALGLVADDLERARARGDREAEAWLYNGLSGAYAENGNAEQALAFAIQALALFDAIGHRLGQARARSSAGAAYRGLGRLDEARAEHEESRRLFHTLGDRLGEARAYHDRGHLYEELGRLDDALADHRHALALRREGGNRQAQATSLIRIGETLLRLGRATDALAPLYEALAIADDIGARPRQSQAHRALAEAHEATGDLAQALAHHRAYHHLLESLLDAEARSRLEVVQLRHDAERVRQEAEIARLRNVELRQKNEQLERLLDELRRTQAQLMLAEKHAGLGRVTAGVAHEIRNPLNFVNNFAELARDDVGELAGALAADPARPTGETAAAVADLLADLETNLHRVVEHGRRADRIVQNMLHHARAAGGTRGEVDLRALLDQAVRRVLTGADVRVEWAAAEALPPVEAAPQALERVFVNLLENAHYALAERRRAEEPGYTPVLRLATEPCEGRVRVVVEDNGPGVPPDVAPRIFEPFFTTKPTGTGTGLGLSLAYDIVTQGHGGALVLEVPEGGGARFIVELPTVELTAGEAPGVATAAAAS